MLFFDSHIKEHPAKIRNGIIARLTDVHPSTGVSAEQFINDPEASDARVTKPKTKKSFIP